MAVTWLHVSDFHFPAKATHEQDVVQDALLTAVRRFHAQGRCPDLIFVTGDIARAGQPAEYERATAYFDELLRSHHLDRNRLFVVPGNHDVDQAAGKYLLRTLDNLTNANAFFDAPQSADYFRKFAAFRTWHEAYFGPSISNNSSGTGSFSTNTTCGPLVKLTINDRELQILPINSALFSQDKTDKGKLWIIPKCLRDVFAALDESPDTVRIALLHHPFDWLHEAERTQIEGLLQQRFDIVLRGHMHETDVRQVITGSGTVLHLAAGAVYQGSERPKKAMYCTLNDNMVMVYPICFNDCVNPSWTDDNSEYPEDPEHIGQFQLQNTRTKNKATKKPISTLASNPVPATPAIESTPLRDRLRSTIEKYTNDPDRSHDPFLQAWTAIDSNPRLSELYSHCTSYDPVPLLWQIERALKRATETASTPTARQKLREHQLPIRMALVAVERHIKNFEKCKESSTKDAPDAPMITMSDKIAAALAVAAWNQLNIVLRRNPDNGTIEIPHLIDDLALPAYGHETMCDMADLEIQKRLDIWRGARTIDNRSAPDGSSRERLSEENIKSGLAVYEQETGTRFIVAIDHGVLSGNFDPALAEHLKNKWLIPLFCFNCPDTGLSDDLIKDWKKLQSDLLDHIQTVFQTPAADNDNAEQSRNASPENISSTPPNPVKLPILFVSYAHDDKIVHEIIKTIRTLERQQHLTLWLDDHLQIGQEWEAEILNKINTCNVAIFLISTAFLGSKFIQNTEIPLLLKRSSESGIPLLPILIEPTDWEAAPWLTKLQMLLTKENGLSNDVETRKLQLAMISKNIREALSDRFRK